MGRRYPVRIPTLPFGKCENNEPLDAQSRGSRTHQIIISRNEPPPFVVSWLGMPAAAHNSLALFVCVCAAICDAVGEDNSHCSNHILELHLATRTEGCNEEVSSFQFPP